MSKHIRPSMKIVDLVALLALLTGLTWGGREPQTAQAATVHQPGIALTQSWPGALIPEAANRYVSPTGLDAGECTSPAGPCATVQYAIDRALPGDAVLVATGVYTDVNTYGGLAQVAYISETLNLRGGYSPDFSVWNPEIYTTTLDAEGQGRAIYITGAISPTLEGFLLTGGDAAGLGGAR